NPNGVWLCVGIGRRTGRYGAPQGVVVHAVPATLELEDLRTACGGAGDAQGKESGLGARACEVHLIGARAGGYQALSQVDDWLVEEIVGRAFGQLGLDSGDHVRVGVA